MTNHPPSPIQCPEPNTVVRWLAFLLVGFDISSTALCFFTISHSKKRQVLFHMAIENVEVRHEWNVPNTKAIANTK